MSEEERQESYRDKRKVALCRPDPASECIRADLSQVLLGSNKILDKIWEPTFSVGSKARTWDCRESSGLPCMTCSE